MRRSSETRRRNVCSHGPMDGELGLPAPLRSGGQPARGPRPSETSKAWSRQRAQTVVGKVAPGECAAQKRMAERGRADFVERRRVPRLQHLDLPSPGDEHRRAAYALGELEETRCSRYMGGWS